MGIFDSDPDALESREAINIKQSKYSLDAWVMEIIKPQPTDAILDLGCGNGRYILSLWQALKPSGRIVGTDISEEVISKVASWLKEEGIENVDLITCSHDDCFISLKNRRFTKIISIYSIYYANDMIGVLRKLKKHLSEDGLIFICGYGAGTNKEVIDVMRKYIPADSLPSTEDEFISDEDIEKLKINYARVKHKYLNNEIYFYSKEQFFAWWTRHNLYRPAIHGIIEDYFVNYFRQNSMFVLSKIVKGVLFGV